MGTSPLLPSTCLASTYPVSHCANMAAGLSVLRWKALPRVSKHAGTGLGPWTHPTKSDVCQKQSQLADLTCQPNYAGYLGAILFEQDVEQPLLGQTMSVTSLVDVEGAALQWQDGLAHHGRHCPQLVPAFRHEPLMTGQCAVSGSSAQRPVREVPYGLDHKSKRRICSISGLKLSCGRCQAPGTRWRGSGMATCCWSRHRTPAQCQQCSLRPCGMASSAIAGAL